MRFLALLALACAFISSPAEARHRHHHRHYVHHTRVHIARAPTIHKDCNILFPCEVPAAVTRVFVAPVQAVTREIRRAADVAVQILPHPEGCPSRAFCGCGAAHDPSVNRPNDRSLWLAANWYRFPRAERAPDMAMVRPHHVAILKQQVQGTLWLIADYNSGGHASRLHVRDTAGWTIVNPRG
jgi:hypothetical protein